MLIENLELYSDDVLYFGSEVPDRIIIISRTNFLALSNPTQKKSGRILNYLKLTQCVLSKLTPS